jgi:SAM-dependent methyltransferase
MVGVCGAYLKLPHPVLLLNLRFAVLKSPLSMLGCGGALNNAINFHNKTIMNDQNLGKAPYRLNVGCGRNIREGWVNLDSAALPGVDIVCDLEKLRDIPIDLPDETVDHFLLSHVIEHIRNSLGLMEELWRLATPEATLIIRVPHGGSDDAWEDPTHVRAYFLGSFGYFSQPYYWRADYGYRADWKPEKIQLQVDKTRGAGLSAQEILSRAQNERNWVREMVCEMRAIKPIRDPKRELQTLPLIEILLVD